MTCPLVDLLIVLYCWTALTVPGGGRTDAAKSLLVPLFLVVFSRCCTQVHEMRVWRVVEYSEVQKYDMMMVYQRFILGRGEKQK